MKRIMLVVIVLLLLPIAFAHVTVNPSLILITKDKSFNLIVNSTETFSQIVTATSNITYGGATIGFISTPYVVNLTSINMSNNTFYASINSGNSQVTILTKGIPGNYAIVNGTPYLEQSVGRYLVNLSSTPVRLYFSTISQNITANISLYNNENDHITNTTNSYGEIGRPLYLKFNPIDNIGGNISNLIVNVSITNSSGFLKFNYTKNVTISTFDTSKFILNDYSLHNYVITIYDKNTSITTIQSGQIQVTNISPTITQLVAMRTGKPGGCVVGIDCAVKMTVNNDGCNLTGQSGYASFTGANLNLLFNSSNWTYLGEISKNFCVFESEKWVPAYVDVVQMNVLYVDRLNQSAFINGTMYIGVDISGASGYTTPIYEASPETVAFLNETTRFYSVFNQSLSNATKLEAILTEVADFFAYPVMTYTTQHCLKFSQSDLNYCEDFALQEIRVWHVVLFGIVAILFFMLIGRIVYDYRRLYKYDHEKELEQRRLRKR